MKYLADTNIFLEILLGQEKKEKCKSFLEKSKHELFISDFLYHSIGVILMRFKAVDSYEKFLEDFESIDILSLPQYQFSSIIENCRVFKLDFDDAYQLSVIKHFGLTLKTMDSDFKIATNKFKIEFID